MICTVCECRVCVCVCVPTCHTECLQSELTPIIHYEAELVYHPQAHSLTLKVPGVSPLPHHLYLSDINCIVVKISIRAEVLMYGTCK